MEVEEIRKTIKVRPFRPFEFHLDNGEIHPVSYLEIIITDTLIVTVDQDGKVVLITPESVSSIKFTVKQDEWN